MKKYFTAVLSVILCIIFSTVITANEYVINGKNSDNIQEKADEFIASLPDEIRGEATDIDTSESGMAESITKKFSFGYLSEILKNTVSEIFSPTLRDFFGIFALIISVAVAKLIFTPENNMLSDCAIKMMNTVISLSVTSVAAIVVSTVGTFVTSVCSMMNSILPVMGAAYITSGQITSSAVSATGMMIYITVTENII